MKIINKCVFFCLFVVCFFCSCSKTNNEVVSKSQYNELRKKYELLLENLEQFSLLQQQYDELYEKYETLLESSQNDTEKFTKLQQQYDELYEKYYDKKKMLDDNDFNFSSLTDFYLKSKQYVNMGRVESLKGKCAIFPISQNDVESASITYHGSEIFSNFRHHTTFDTSSNTISSFVKFSLWVILNDYDITKLQNDETICIVGTISNVDFMFSSSGEGYISIALVDCFVLEAEK